MRPRFNFCKVVPNSLSACTGLEREPIEDSTVISPFASVSYGTITIPGGAEIGGLRPVPGEADRELMKPHKGGSLSAFPSSGRLPIEYPHVARGLVLDPSRC